MKRYMHRGFVFMFLFVTGVVAIGASGSKDPVLSATVDDSDIETLPAWALLEPHHAEFLRVNLQRYELFPLNDTESADTVLHIRFLWLRSFHRAVLFEVKFQTDGSGVYESNFWREKGDGFHWVKDITKKLNDTDLKSQTLMIERYGLFEEQWFDGHQYFDGASWFIEIQQGDKYHAIYRDTPKSGPIWELGRGMIERAIESEYLPIY